MPLMTLLDIKHRKINNDDCLKEITMEILEKENIKREKWSNTAQFILACIGYSVGMNNIWRFPYVAYENGGGAFQFAYIVLLIFVGIPLYIMELGIGQFSSKGPLEMWKCCPIGIGIGRAMMIIAILPRCGMNVLISYTIIYMVSSFTSQLPWHQCEEWWGADENCFIRNSSVYKEYNDTWNSSFTDNNNNIKEVASKQYWERYVLNLNPTMGVNDFSSIEWKVIASLAVTVLCVYLTVFQGLKNLGKVLYISALFPYVILVAFVIQSLMLDGASEGLYYFFVPTWEKVFEIKTWMSAARQMFFSLGIGNGVLITLSSHNNFHNNIYKNAALVALADFLTCIIGSVIIFSVLGMLSKDLNVPIAEVFAGGQGLAFITFPEISTKMPAPQFWSFSFFFMLFILGINSSFTGFQSAFTVITDEYPSLRKHKKMLYLISTIIIFCLGLPFTSPGGHYLLILIDIYNVLCRAAIAAIEVIFIMWIYGYDNFCADIKFMLGSNPNQYFRICWAYISPLLIVVLSIVSFANYTLPKYGNYHYPAWAHIVGWLFVGAILIQIPIGVLLVLYKQWKSGNIKGAFKPTADWGPCLHEVDIKPFATYTDIPLKEPPKI